MAKKPRIPQISKSAVSYFFAKPATTIPMLSLCYQKTFVVNQNLIFGFESAAVYAAKNAPQERLK
jgi:hypothetical protein